MDIMEAMHTRRSIRKFTDAPVTDEQLETILKAAMVAPSAGNAQPWQFIVVTDREKLDAIPEWQQYAKACHTAQAAIVVCGDLSLEKYEGFWVQDCSAATMNILHAVHGLGLGAVWCGIAPVQERVAAAQKQFGLPDNVIPLSVIPIGVPDQKAGTVDRYREDRIHRNTWK